MLKIFNSRQTRKKMTTLSLVVLLVFLTACAGFYPKNDAIRVNLSSLKMLESTLFEQRFEANIRIQNRSQTELQVKGLSYDLFLNDKAFATGVSNHSVNIEPLSEGVITINLTSTLFSLLRQVKSMQTLENEPFSYDLHGKVFTGNDMFGLTFSEKGEIDLTTAVSREN